VQDCAIPQLRRILCLPASGLELSNALIACAAILGAEGSTLHDAPIWVKTRQYKSVFAQTGIALFADRMPVDLVSQFFLEQMVGLGYMATSLTLNVLAVSSPHIYVSYKICVRLSSHQKWSTHMISLRVSRFT